MSTTAQRLEIPVRGMDCVECCANVRRAIAAVPGVQTVDVFLTSEKAIIETEPEGVDLAAVRRAVDAAGYSIPELENPAGGESRAAATAQAGAQLSRKVLWLTGFVVGAVLFVVVVGEWFGFFETATAVIPWPVGVALVLVGWYPILVNVLRAARQRQVIAHTLMSVGVVAALAVGQWVTAAVVVFFMRVGDYVEHFTTERARRAVRELSALAPRTARVLRDGAEVEMAADEVLSGDVVVVRPGESIPVDGEVIAGQATVNQAAITGEALPVEVGPGAQVYAATLAQFGSLRIRTRYAGKETTFGRVVRMVEEAEANRADVQRTADRFSAYFLPVVATIAGLTLVLSRDPLATAAVLVVACSCSFALATPIAMLASIGAGAKRGLLIKGGKVLEVLAQADVLLIDKTGTVTLGAPQITDVVVLDGRSEDAILALAGAAERYSEHPLAEAVRQACRSRGLELGEPEHFEAIPGVGVQARVNSAQITVGRAQRSTGIQIATRLEAQGKTLIYVGENGAPIGILAATDTLRPEAPAAIAAMRRLGIVHVELLTGDNAATAAEMAAAAGVSYRAELLPADKLTIVKEYQARGHKVIMVGDGVNDAPALAQADVGIAMGAAGSAIAVEAAHVALMADNWQLVPEVYQIAQRTMRVVRFNLGFTVAYNAIGLTLAAFGFLPPVLAAAAQSIPDLGILANSSRLLRQGNSLSKRGV